MAVNDGDVVKVVVDIDAPNLVIMQNVFYWRLDDPTPDNPSNAQIITALDTRVTDIYEQVDAYMNQDYLVDEFTAERIEWNVDVWETVENLGTAALAVAGEDLTGGVPHGAAATITAQTSRPQTRARKFIPGVGEDQVDESTLSGALLTALALFATSWLTDQLVTGSAELIPVVVGQSGASAGLVYPLLSTAASGIIGYQRRRKPGVGA